MYWKTSLKIFLSVLCLLLLTSYLSFADPLQLGDWIGEVKDPGGQKAGVLLFTISDDPDRGAIVSYLDIHVQLPCADDWGIGIESLTRGITNIIGDKFIINVEKQNEKGVIEGKFLSVKSAEGTWDYAINDPQFGLCKNEGTWTANPFDGTLELDGSWGVFASDSPSLDPGDKDWTIEAWVYPTSWPEAATSKAYWTIAEKKESYGLALRFDPNAPKDKRGIVFIYSNIGHWIASDDFEPNKWYHIAGVFDNHNDTVAICINGQKYVKDELYTEDLPNTNTDLLVGKPTWEGFEHFEGKIAELRISDVVRYPDELFIPPSKPFQTDANTRGLWHFDEGVPPYVDASGNRNTLIGDVVPTKYRFPLELTKGLNMISLPLKPDAPFTARSFAQKLNATLIIKFDLDEDTSEKTFIPFITEVSVGDGFFIEGGKGYIVNVLETKSVTFEGTAWGEEIQQAPAPLIYNRGAWAFVVTGFVHGVDGKQEASEYIVRATNKRTGFEGTSPIGSIGQGRFAITFADLNRRNVVEVGNELEITIINRFRQVVAGPISLRVEITDIDKGYLKVDLARRHLIPFRSALLQNYPNPFNPETWIPYQLASSAEVSIRIYNIAGQLVRTLDLGHKEAGIYHSQARTACWDGKNDFGEKVSNGIYYYSIQAGTFSATRKLAILK